MANLYSFSAFLLTDIPGVDAAAIAIDVGTTFDPAAVAQNTFIASDTSGENTIQGDPAPNGEVSSDPENDQVAFVKDENGDVVVDGTEFFVELSFVFSVGGEFFVGYQLEIVGTGQNFIVLPPNIPAGPITVQSRDFSPLPDEINYAQLGSGDEEIQDNDFTNLDSGSADLITAGAGDDTINAEGGADTVLAGDGNDIVFGGAGRDVIEAGAGDDDVTAGGGGDEVSGDLGNDSLSGEGGNDTLTGGDGDDTIDGGTNDDLITGDEQEQPGAERLSLNWELFADPDNNTSIDNGDDLSGGEAGTGATDSDFSAVITQDTGGIDVGVSFLDRGNATSFEFGTTDGFTGGLNSDTEVADGESSLFLEGVGLGDTSTTRLDFSSNDPRFQDEVENVAFRINDIDDDGWRDIVTIRAFNANGDPITVNLTGAPNFVLTDTDGVAGADTATAINNIASVDPDNPNGSLLVEVPGPVARIEIDYGNLEADGQRVDVTDVFFDAVPVPVNFVDGADSLSGGDGDDTVLGNGGDDTLDGGTGNDSLTGGDGFDDFVFSAGTDEITDFNTATGQVLNDGNQDNNDFIDLDPFYANLFQARADLANDGILNGNATIDSKGRAIDPADINPPGALTLTGVAPGDIFFDNVNLICFADGTMIRTPEGDRMVEDLAVGDLVETRDHGARPIRWIGSRALPKEALMAQPRLRPVVISKGALGNERALRVSRQHRMLVKSWRAEMLFGEAEILVKAADLIDGDAIYQSDAEAVTYFHILFDEHEIVFAEGAESESFHPGAEALSTLDADAREELCTLFPEIEVEARPTARQALKGHEARALCVA